MIDAILAGEAPALPASVPLAGLRLAVPENFALDDMDSHVSAAFDRTLGMLSKAGARIVHIRFATFDAIPTVNAKVSFATAEAYAWHRALLAEKGGQYDPRIRLRIERGEKQSAADYVDLLAARRRLVAEFDAATRPFDAVLLPTTPIVPPRLAELEDEREYNRQNLLILRNTAVGNFLDRCAISLPCHRPDEPPVGLMLMGETLGDARLFSLASAVEAALA
jgi:aspartyl-tRNA(Asn)/glutamyl-tRNA(Gln) amidotransferase subunit A